jgi:hypothetical protein
MGEHNSPYFEAGLADGERDTMLNSAHPGGLAQGMDPEKDWSWMYKRGYGRTFDPSAFHLGCDLCDEEEAAAHPPGVPMEAVP